MSLTNGAPVFIMPDLIAFCGYPFSINPFVDECRQATDKWIDIPGALSPNARAKVVGLNMGLLAAMTYPKADPVSLQICADCLSLFFHLDDLTDEMGVKDNQAVRDSVVGVMCAPEDWKERVISGEAPAICRLMYDLWMRIAAIAGLDVQRRFRSTFDFYLKATTEEAGIRASGEDIDIETYVALRRDSSAARTCFALIELAAGMNLPEDVFQHPLVRSLEDIATDLVGWTNDVFPFNVEQARGDPHNLVVVVMRDRGLDLQGAFDFVGEMFKKSVLQFAEDSAKLPSWDLDMDKKVKTYLQGMQDWVVGEAHWSYETHRYFGMNGLDLKKDRKVELLPRRRAET